MTVQSSNRAIELKAIYKMISDFYRRDTLKLITRLREKGDSDRTIAKILEIEHSLITKYYPRVKQEETK